MADNENALDTQSWSFPEFKSWNPFAMSSFAMQYGTNMNPENSAQGAKRESGEQQASQEQAASPTNFENVAKTFMDFKKLYDRGTAGTPIPGSSDIRVKYSASGQPYTVAGTSPEEDAKAKQLNASGLSKFYQDNPQLKQGAAYNDVNAPKSWETQRPTGDLAGAVESIKKARESAGFDPETGVMYGITRHYANYQDDKNPRSESKVSGKYGTVTAVEQSKKKKQTT